LSCFFSRRGFSKTSELGFGQIWDLFRAADGQKQTVKKTVSGKTKATRVLGGWFVVNSGGWAFESKNKSHPVSQVA
jgi:hypothetical protein